jgi:hypothetical protein
MLEYQIKKYQKSPPNIQSVESKRELGHCTFMKRKKERIAGKAENDKNEKFTYFL